MTVTVTAITGGPGQTIHAVTATDSLYVPDSVTVGTATVTDSVAAPDVHSDRTDPLTKAVEEELAPDWFTPCLFLVPRPVREVWLGHIHEDRAEMTRGKMSRWWIETCTGWQLLLFVCQCFWSLVLQVVDIIYRLK